MTTALRAAMEMDSRIRDAYIFATAAHGAVGQMRPTLDAPHQHYIVHPVEVADIVARTPGVTSEMLMAAVLHDVGEDTKVSILTIEQFFGSVVAAFVLHLTDYYTPERFPDMNRKVRKLNEALRYAAVPVAVKTIKLADGLSNTPSIAENRPKFMTTYGPEKRRLIESLRGGDSGLWVRLNAMLDRYGY